MVDESRIFCREKWALSEDGSELRIVRQSLRAPEGLLTEDAIDETEAVTQVKQEKLPLFSAEEEKATRGYVQACALPLGRSDIAPLSFPPAYIPMQSYMCPSLWHRQRNNDGRMTAW